MAPRPRRPRRRGSPDPGRLVREEADMEKIPSHLRALRQELRQIARRGRSVWRMVSARHKWALTGAVLLMSVASAANTMIPVLLGFLVNQLERVKRLTGNGPVTDDLLRSAMFYLVLIGRSEER